MNKSLRATMLTAACILCGTISVFASQLNLIALENDVAKIKCVLRVKVTKVERGQTHMKLKDGPQGPMTSCHIVASGNLVSVVWGTTGLKKIQTKYTWQCGNVYNEEGKIILTKSFITSGSGSENDIKEGEEYLFSYRYAPVSADEKKIPVLGHMRSDPVSSQGQILKLLRKTKEHEESSNKPDAGETPKPPPGDVKALGARVADWMIRHENDSFKFKAGRGATRNAHSLDWTRGALYAGMWEYASIAGDEMYFDWLNGIGKKTEYGLSGSGNKYHADPHAVAQTWLKLYRRHKDPAMLAATKQRCDWIMANPRTGSLKWGTRTDAHKRWGWCDALFMAPPVWARLAEITGEKKHLAFMHQEYQAAYDLLWDKEEKLFWRDSSFFKKRERNGKKVFWARGNGWVFGGLSLMLPDLPSDWEHRVFYVDLFKTMAVRLRDIQRPDGTWSMGLLGDAKDYPTIETSGTGFFVFGLAWGINQGILDRATYEPTVLKGWQALSDCVDKDGLLGYVQPVGAAPGKSYPNKTEDYGVGAFLAASAEVYKLVCAQK